jgi:uncharacterized protein YtpQ (UPF0354 family)
MRAELPTLYLRLQSARSHTSCETPHISPTWAEIPQNVAEAKSQILDHHHAGQRLYRALDLGGDGVSAG